MELYSGLDLHSRNTYIGILDTDFKRVFKKRITNDIDLILETLEPFREQLKITNPVKKRCRLKVPQPLPRYLKDQQGGGPILMDNRSLELSSESLVLRARHQAASANG